MSNRLTSRVLCTSMAAHSTARTQPSHSPTISTSVCSSSPRSLNVVMPPNASVCSLDRHQSTEPLIDNQSSQPKFARSPWIPNPIHLYDLDAMSVSGRSATLHTGRPHCRLLLPWILRDGDRRHWRVHLGKQYVSADTMQRSFRTLTYLQRSRLSFSSSTAPTGAP